MKLFSKFSGKQWGGSFDFCFPHSSGNCSNPPLFSSIGNITKQENFLYCIYLQGNFLFSGKKCYALRKKKIHILCLFDCLSTFFIQSMFSGEKIPSKKNSLFFLSSQPNIPQFSGNLSAFIIILSVLYTRKYVVNLHLYVMDFALLHNVTIQSKKICLSYLVAFYLPTFRKTFVISRKCQLIIIDLIGITTPRCFPYE